MLGARGTDYVVSTSYFWLSSLFVKKEKDERVRDLRTENSFETIAESRRVNW